MNIGAPTWYGKKLGHTLSRTLSADWRNAVGSASRIASGLVDMTGMGKKHLMTWAGGNEQFTVVILTWTSEGWGAAMGENAHTLENLI